MPTPDAEELTPTTRLDEMSPAAWRLLTESSRWWPREDGSVGILIDASSEEMDALRELCEVLSAALGIDLNERAEPGPEPDLGDGDGLTFRELQELRQRGRWTAPR